MRSPLILLPILSGVMWGAAGVFVRVLSEWGMDSTTIVFTRVSLATVMMLLLILATDRSLLRVRPRDLWMFAACAVSMLGLNLFYTISIERVSLSLAAVLLSLSPLFMLLMARAVFGERVTSRKAFCMVTCVAGCVLVSGFLEGGSEFSAVGVLAGVVSAVFYAVYGIVSKRAGADGYSPYTILFYCLLICTIALLPLSDLGMMADCMARAPSDAGFLVLHAAVASFLPYILYTVSMVRLEAGATSLLAACGEPVAAAVFGVLVFSEVPTPLMLAGMAVAIASMAVLCMPHRGDGEPEAA